MIGDVMVWLDGGAYDEIRLAAVADMTRQLQTRTVIGLYLNVLPLPGPIVGEATAEIVEHAREIGNAVEKALVARLAMLDRMVEIRRFDVALEEHDAAAEDDDHNVKQERKREESRSGKPLLQLLHEGLFRLRRFHKGVLPLQGLAVNGGVARKVSPIS